MDVNDHAPTFSQTHYFGDLIENNYVGMVVLHVNVTDADVGANADIYYSIEGKTASGWRPWGRGGRLHPLQHKMYCTR